MVARTELGKETLASFLITGSYCIMRPDQSISMLWSSTVIASVYMSLIPILQAHGSPIITLALASCNKFPWAAVPQYLAAQAIAGGAAISVGKFVFLKTEVVYTASVFSWYQNMVVETFYTAMLVFVILNSHCRTNAPHWMRHHFNHVGIVAIGCVIVAASLSAGSVSGGILNPVISVINALLCKDAALYSFLLVLYQFLGCVVGVLMFAAVRRPEEVLGAVDGLPAVAREATFSAQLAAEFIGAFTITLTVCLNIMANSSLTPLASAAVVLALTCSLEDVSGGHFNPAITLAVAALKQSGLKLSTALCFGVSQIAGGIFAGVLYSGIYNAGSFPLRPRAPYKDSSAYVLEFLFTFVLATVYLSTVTAQLDQEKRTNYLPLCMGGSLLACSAASVPVSGGCLNPALAIGMGTADALNFGSFLYPATYVCMQLLGGAAAAAFFLVLHGTKDHINKQKFHITESSSLAAPSWQSTAPVPVPPKQFAASNPSLFFRAAPPASVPVAPPDHRHNAVQNDQSDLNNFIKT